MDFQIIYFICSLHVIFHQDSQYLATSAVIKRYRTPRLTKILAATF